jgi:hypothetical protein
MLMWVILHTENTPMLSVFLRWLDQLLTLPAIPSTGLDAESRTRIARLNEMYDDISRLTHEEWRAKWRPDDPRP